MTQRNLRAYRFQISGSNSGDCEAGKSFGCKLYWQLSISQS
jgi:hypothetical protein